MEAKRIELKGVVQGGGFRPFVYTIAHNYGIKGWVLNNSQGVFIHAEGETEDLERFLAELFNNPPGRAIIKEKKVLDEKPQGFPEFTIVESQSGGEQEVLISPDLAMCSQCFEDVTTPGNRRYKYAFTNCTNCGPRFTIIKGVPYDRTKTTMAEFPMCSICSAEYHDPFNRRFHAQPNACPQCGPQVVIFDHSGKEIPEATPHELLYNGFILAVKGLGGYHLVCDAKNSRAVNRLRESKKREAKPFAVMAKNIEVVKKYCYLTPQEEKLLTGPQAPIVILPRKKRYLPSSLAPGVNTLGVMLPYAPLHLLLFRDELELLVMTSGNISSNPLIYQDDEAFSQLKEIADFFVIHNREIYNRCDDSVVKVINGEPQLFRRARGYVPLPVEIPEQPSVFACGGDLKSTFCLTKGNKAFLSQHMGDLDNYLNLQEYILTAQRMQEYLAIEPQAVVIDLHPRYNSHKWGREWDKPVIEVQHHHAHLASCLADNGLNEKVLGVICDGTGYGTDGNIWGMEFLLGDFSGFERLAHLEYVPLPGGDAAIKEPLRMSVSYLYKYLREKGLLETQKYLAPLKEEEIRLFMQQIDLKVNCPLTSSCGRLFDAVSGLLGVCTKVNYEGQAAIELEEMADRTVKGSGYSFEIIKGNKVPYVISTEKMWPELLENISRGIKAQEIAAKFHWTLAQIITQTCVNLKSYLSSPKIALSGGVMQNKLLIETLVPMLKEHGFEPLLHRQVPANDGGLSLGQAVIGGRLRKCV
ncbi:MAG: carbamoyltransferase HypF [Clostridia bacterium]|nr:carbamoyltransferase HypF [Clostridia bacterium]